MTQAALSTEQQGTVREYRVVIPKWHPQKLNRLMSVHWAKAAKWKDEDCQTMGWFCKLAGVPKVGLTAGEVLELKHRGLPHVASKLSSARKRSVQLEVVLAGRGRNPDSADCWNKSCQDGLVRCGMLVDDGDKWMDWLTPVVTRGKEKSTTIVLRDL